MTEQTEQNSISKLLDLAIHQCIRTKDYAAPEIILIHPQTFCKLLLDYSSQLSYFGGYDVNANTYRGIKIIRSLDISEDKIYVY